MIKIHYFKLFAFPFIQLILLSANTIFIVNGLYIFIFLDTIILNLVWSYNVKNIVIANLKERFIYSIGAALGALTGVYLCKIL